MGAKSVHKLSSENDTNILLFGIASHENDYRISWALNNTIGLKFIKSENHQSFHKRFNEMQEFSAYTSLETEDLPMCKLIANRCDNGFLLEELKNIDYLLLVESGEKQLDVNLFIQQIRSISFIATAFTINPSSIKAINRIK